MAILTQKFASWRPSLPYAISAALHLLILAISGHALVTKAEFGMDIGDGGMAGYPEPLEAEIELFSEPEETPIEPELKPEPRVEQPDLSMEAPELYPPEEEPIGQLKTEPQPQQVVPEKVLPKQAEPPKPEPKKVEPRKIQVARPAPVVRQTNSLQGTGSGGAYISVNKPDYLRNPAPAYPASAKRKGQQGLVLITVYVNDRGSVDRVQLRRSSGYSTLDQIALKCVKKWKFRAAKVGGIRVKSKVSVPVRFRLK